MACTGPTGTITAMNWAEAAEILASPTPTLQAIYFVAVQENYRKLGDVCPRPLKHNRHPCPIPTLLDPLPDRNSEISTRCVICRVTVYRQRVGYRSCIASAAR